MVTMAVSTLQIRPGFEDKAWKILDDANLNEISGLYFDNGGEPDGNAWLPSLPIENDACVQKVIDENAGVIVEAFYYHNDWESVSENLRIRRDTTPEAYAEQRGADTVEWEDVLDALEHAQSISCWASFGNGETIVILWK
jgi:hypothetical protein